MIRIRLHARARFKFTHTHAHILKHTRARVQVRARYVYRAIDSRAWREGAYVHFGRPKFGGRRILELEQAVELQWPARGSSAS